MIRDFTKNSIDSFRDDLKEYKGEKDLFGLNYRFEDYDILCELDIVHYLDDVKNYGKSVVSKYKTADKKLDGILKQVETVDANYAARFDAVYGRMKAFHQQIRNFTTIMTPEAIDLGEQYYGDYVKTFQDLYAAEVTKSEKRLEELENLSAVYDTEWYEDVINGVGGFLVSLARDEIEGYLFVGTLLSNFIKTGALSTEGSDNISEILDCLEREYLNDLYTNKTWYYGGRSVGDMTSMAVGAVMAAQGISTIIGSFSLGAAAGGLSLTGGGAIIGFPAWAVSVAGVALGVAQASVGVPPIIGGARNFKDNWDKFEKSKDGGSGSKGWLDDVNLKINVGQQNKHIPGTNNYKQEIANGKLKSILSADPQQLLDDFAGTGKKIGKNKERVDFGSVIGKYVNPETGEAVDTTVGIIHYGKNGAHIVPARPK